MKTCKECGWKVARTFSLSWDEFGICPKCADTRTLVSKKYDAPVLTVEYNPVDLYWSFLTHKALLTNEVICKECKAKKGYHTLECSIGNFGGFHPSM